MLCYVIKPSTMTDREMESPECMKQIKVQVGELRDKFMSSQSSFHHVSSETRGPETRQDNRLAVARALSGPFPDAPGLPPPNSCHSLSCSVLWFLSPPTTLLKPLSQPAWT